MIPAAFDYHRPGSLDEAVALLQRHGDQAKVLSGGMSLLPTLKLRLGAFEHLVDIGRIPGLDYIKEDGGFLRIGAMTRQATLERSDLIRSKYPIIADAVPLIADPLVRNRVTIGGNVANGDPANDQPAIISRSAPRWSRAGQGERTIAANSSPTSTIPRVARRDPHRDPHPGPAARAAGRTQARAQDRRLRDRGRGGAQLDASAVASAGIAHQCGSDSARSGGRREVPHRQDA
jgi:hypothetical protein